MPVHSPPPINVLLSKSCELLLGLRFALFTSRYAYKCCTRSSSLVVHSLRRLEIDSKYSSHSIHLVKNVSIFKSFILQNYVLQIIYRSITSPLFTYSFSATFSIFLYTSFEITNSFIRGKKKSCSIFLAGDLRQIPRFLSPSY